MSRSPLNRQTAEASTLALIALFAVALTRYGGESHGMLLGEALSMAVLFAGLMMATIRGGRSIPVLTVLLIAVPLLWALVSRFLRLSSAAEMTALTTLGGVALSLAPRSDRHRSMSIVASGFLTLFAVSISDRPVAVWLAIAWMSVCVWHWVANHWDRLELCAVDNVRRGASVRPLSVIAAIGLCIIGALLVPKELAVLHRFTAQVMPTSGGSRWSDPSARQGVGTGELAIAAKDHAESFGAVETDLFLESTESTLFDMFSDTAGEPKKPKIQERRQGLSSQTMQTTHEKTAKSEKGGGSFSTDREMPKVHHHFDDAVENAVVQWVGPTGIRLAMHRYDTFDGILWTASSSASLEKLPGQKIGDAMWFFDPETMQTTLDSPKLSSGALKILRLDSTRLPTPMLASALHIKDVEIDSFFGVHGDACFFMPGRDRIPPMTVVNVASLPVTEDEVRSGLKIGHLDNSHVGITAMLDSIVDRNAPAADQLQSVIDHLRGDFAFDRRVESQGDDPIDEFLRTRRGGDHWFATTAALAARGLGLPSRLVTGFYVRPSAIDMTAGHSNVLPDDVHVWVEVQLSDGRWIEMEPTPGYRQPVYSPSLWLLTQRFAAANWPHAMGLACVAALIFATRILWVESLLVVGYWLGVLIWPRRQFVLAMRVLQARARWAGCPREAGRPQRDWLLELTQPDVSLSENVKRFCDAADHSTFGGDPTTSLPTTISRELLMRLKTKTMQSLTAEALA